MKKLTISGFLLTAFWLAIFLKIVVVNWSSAKLLSFNEWGDFLAGLTAPLALLWLVIGYFQQGKELHLNTEALLAQQEQLKRQVQETAVLAENSERQAIAAERMALLSKEESEKAALKERAEAQPLFRPKGGNKNGATIKTTLRNDGATVSNVSVETDEQIEITILPTNEFKSGQEGTLKINNVTRFPFCFRISYQDKLGEGHIKTFEAKGPHQYDEV